jgi:hypothetical protein
VDLLLKYDETPKFNEFQGNHIVALVIASMVEMAIQTNRTLVLPQYIRAAEAFGAPTHAFVDVRSLGVPYRVMTREEAFEIKPDDMQVVKATRMFHATLDRTLEARYADTKYLAIERVCAIGDYDLIPVLEKRISKLKWCLDQEIDWTRTVGGFMDSCDNKD